MSAIDIAIESYLKIHYERCSLNDFLQKNASLVNEEFDDRTWYNKFSIWKNRFFTKAKQMISDEGLIKKNGVSSSSSMSCTYAGVVPVKCRNVKDTPAGVIPKLENGLQNEEPRICFWKEVEHVQSVKSKQLKLKRKVDITSVDIFDKSTSQQGNEILNLYNDMSCEMIKKHSNEMNSSSSKEVSMKSNTMYYGQSNSNLKRSLDRITKDDFKNVENQINYKKKKENENMDNCVKNLLNEKQKCSKSMSNLIDNFQKYCADTKNEMTSNEIMDLKPTSEFVMRYTKEVDHIQVLKEVFEPVDKLFPDKGFYFLSEFFSEGCNYQKWQDKLETLLLPEEDPFLRKLKRFMFEILPIFFDVFDQLHDNPLKDHEMLEDEGNKAIDASYYRKLIMNQKGNADRSDGIAYTTNEKHYEFCVTEGSKPYNVDFDKEIADYIQNARAGKDMLNFVVISEVKSKRVLPENFRVYMVQSYGLNLSFYFMDFLGTYRLFEVESCELPTDFIGVNLFPFFFRAIITWVLMIGETDSEFQRTRNKRNSRYSNAHNLWALSEIHHNQPRKD
ncbi:5252_t:CDS:10, partial [Funneliformis caledonium]